MPSSNIQPAPDEAAIEPDLPIIDAHHHLWLEPPFPQFQPFMIADLAAERARSGHNIPATVHIDCQTGYLKDGPPEMRTVGETRTIAQWVSAATDPAEQGIAAKIVSRADMRLGAKVEDVLRAHIEASPDRFRGIRHMTTWHAEKGYYGLDTSDRMMRTPAFCEGVSRLAALGLSFDAMVFLTQLEDVAYLARAVPQAVIILNHVGAGNEAMPGLSAEDSYAIWRSGVAQVASCPNVVVKLGGLMMHHESPQPIGSEEAAAAMRDYILPTIELFTPERCLFESNFPVDQAHISYGNLWNAFKRLTADFTRAERETMFAGAAARVYRINLADL
jgi:predicted TIM-barrel fold metal-dependent hydrolase